MLPKILTFIVAIVVLIVAPACGGGGSAPAVPATPTPTANTTNIIATATAYAQSLRAKPKTAATPTATPAPREMIVANTGGMGVYIRRTPAMQDKIKAWPDGTVMTITGKVTEGEGRKWWPVEDPDGNKGYVPSDYLEPQ